MHSKLLKSAEKIIYVSLRVVLGVNVEVTNLVPEAVEVSVSVLRLVVDKVLSAMRMIMDGKFCFGEMPFPS
ncbi:hypothetical protein BV497_05550 [Fulvimonas soli]|nr:hypothetical protein BV497_05550 [Fulvimonas soli]